MFVEGVLFFFLISDILVVGILCCGVDLCCKIPSAGVADLLVYDKLGPHQDAFSILPDPSWAQLPVAQVLPKLLL